MCDDLGCAILPRRRNSPIAVHSAIKLYATTAIPRLKPKRHKLPSEAVHAEAYLKPTGLSLNPECPGALCTAPHLRKRSATGQPGGSGMNRV